VSVGWTSRRAFNSTNNQGGNRRIHSTPLCTALHLPLADLVPVRCDRPHQPRRPVRWERNGSWRNGVWCAFCTPQRMHDLSRAACAPDNWAGTVCRVPGLPLHHPGSDWWFPPDGGRMYRMARRVCASCPVRRACGVEALENRYGWGMWGGWSPGGRDRVLAEARAATPLEAR